MLGDWVAVCVGCGHAQRYFEESEAELPGRCPECDAELRARCPRCGSRFSSVFAVSCDECGGDIRPNWQFGGPIRREN